MLDIHTFNDTDGNAVEINRRTVVDAYIERLGDRCTIEIAWGEGKACSLGIGAREEIETWLGRELPFLSPVAAAYRRPPEKLPAAKDLAWLDILLADLRDKAIVRVGPAVASYNLAALAMIVLHPCIGPVPAHHQRACRLLRKALDAFGTLPEDCNDVRAPDEYHRAAMDEIALIKGLAASSDRDSHAKPVGTAEEWLSSKLLALRDEAIRRLGPSNAAWHIATLAWVVLNPPAGDPLRFVYERDLLCTVMDALGERVAAERTPPQPSKAG
jgi:hypothetical protein